MKQNNIQLLYNKECLSIKSNRVSLYKTIPLTERQSLASIINLLPDCDRKYVKTNHSKIPYQTTIEKQFQKYLEELNMRYTKYVWEELSIYTIKTKHHQEEIIIKIIPIVISIHGIWFKQF